MSVSKEQETSIDILPSSFCNLILSSTHISTFECQAIVGNIETMFHTNTCNDIQSLSIFTKYNLSKGLKFVTIKP